MLANNFMGAIQMLSDATEQYTPIRNQVRRPCVGPAQIMVSPEHVDLSASDALKHNAVV